MNTQCPECGDPVIQKGRGRPRRFCSDVCKQRAHNRLHRRALPPLRKTEQRACARCGKTFESVRRSHVYCSQDCGMALYRNRARRGLDGPQERPCDACGLPFLAKTVRARFCSTTCRNRHHGLLRARQGRADVKGDYLDRQVFERDNWTCHLCGGAVDPLLPRLDPMGATIDHLTPISLGGLDELANVATAHWSCNRQKGNRVAVA